MLAKTGKTLKIHAMNGMEECFINTIAGDSFLYFEGENMDESIDAMLHLLDMGERALAKHVFKNTIIGICCDMKFKSIRRLHKITKDDEFLGRAELVDFIKG
jgi:hypothetical protein